MAIKIGGEYGVVIDLNFDPHHQDVTIRARRQSLKNIAPNDDQVPVPYALRLYSENYDADAALQLIKERFEADFVQNVKTGPKQLTIHLDRLSDRDGIKANLASIKTMLEEMQNDYPTLAALEDKIKDLRWRARRQTDSHADAAIEILKLSNVLLTDDQATQLHEYLADKYLQDEAKFHITKPDSLPLLTAEALVEPYAQAVNAFLQENMQITLPPPRFSQLREKLAYALMYPEQQKSDQGSFHGM